VNAALIGAENPRSREIATIAPAAAHANSVALAALVEKSLLKVTRSRGRD
jgi:hypothetical protein